VGVALVLHVFYLVGDRTWWGEWVAIWPPVGWLVLGLPGVIRSRSGLAGGLLLALVALHGELPKWTGPSESPGPRIRVVSWNVAGDSRSWAELTGLDADVIAVQESAGRPRPEWKGYEWYGGSDSAVLTRLPAEPLPTRRVGPWTEPQLLRLAPQGRAPILFVNVRLTLPSIVTWVAGGFRDGNPARGHDVRVRQYTELAALIQDTRQSTGLEHVLLVGDFNAPPRMPSLAPIHAVFRDCWQLAGRGWGGTATADLPLARIDHCWATRDLRVLSAETARRSVSDHRLLIVDLWLPPDPRESGGSEAEQDDVRDSDR
jgi:endonuclease/exonuclease/phosphatase (EEP) superfamily protein YafD